MLDVQGIKKRFAQRVVLDETTTHIGADEVRVIIGVNGCGKSTLLKIIAGIIVPEGGRILLKEQDITEMPPEERHIGYVPQHPSLFNNMTVEENIIYSMKNGRGSHEDLGKLIDLLNLEEYRLNKPRELSGGYRSRVALGRALFSRPHAMLLDEPLTEVDRAKKERMLPEFKGILRNQKIPVIYITHDPWEADIVGDTFSIMDRGKILDISTPDEAFEFLKKSSEE